MFKTIPCSGQKNQHVTERRSALHCTALHFDIYCFMMNEELSWALGKIPKTLYLAQFS
jgi:hypothetical protein